MAIRLFLVIGLSILLGLPVGINTPAVVATQLITDSLSDTVTVVGSDTVTAGSFGSERVLCPDGMIAVGGPTAPTPPPSAGRQVPAMMAQLPNRSKLPSSVPPCQV
jgi:hypothetical protein